MGSGIERMGTPETPEIRPSTIFLGSSIVVALILALSTKQDALSAEMVISVGQWILQVCLALGIVMTCHYLLQRRARLRKLGPWVGIVLSGSLGALLFSGPALLIDMLVGQDPWPDSWTALTTAWRGEWAGSFLIVLICWLGMNAPFVAGFRLLRPNRPKKEIVAKDSVRPKPANENQTDQSLQIPEAVVSQEEPLLCAIRSVEGELLYIKAELQYIKVVTDRRSELLLGGLGEAAKLLPETEGLQVHRSWWVALHAVEDLVRQGRQGELLLHDGTRVPVSRSRWTQVRDRLAAWG